MSSKEITLKSARLIRGLTQKELSELIGVHEHTIADWEKEPGKVPMSKAQAIIKVLGTTFDIFFN